ncbi:hypothetical protein M885DRAFT_624325 [Pelagophyceae sp. CCMP2097]|nr:hypothetical protein M885DRAFT_624325 [Pelagophyceae sp. CCMP2097]
MAASADAARPDGAARGRARARGVRELLDLDLGRPTDDLDALLDVQLEASTAQAAALVVAWEVEDVRASKVGAALDALDARLGKLESWLGDSRSDLDAMRECVEKIADDNNSLEVQRTNLSSLAKAVDRLVSVEDGLGLEADVEALLRAPADFLDAADAGSTLEDRCGDVAAAASALRRGLRRAADLRRDKLKLACVADRGAQLARLADGFGAQVAAYVARAALRLVVRAGPPLPAAGDGGAGSALARAARPWAELRGRQGDLHAALADYEKLVIALALLDRADDLAQLRASYASTVSSATTPLLAAYFDALAPHNARTRTRSFAAEVDSCAGALSKAHDDIVPLVLREREFVGSFFALDAGDGADRACIDGVVSTMFAEFERSALALVAESDLTLPDLVAAYAAAQPREAEVECGLCARALGSAAKAAALKFQESTRHLAFKIAAAPIKRNAKKLAFPAVVALASFIESIGKRSAEERSRKRSTFRYESVSVLVEPAVEALGDALLRGWLDKAVRADKKYSDVIRIENVAALKDALRSADCKDVLGRSAALQALLVFAEAESVSAVGRYVVWMFEYEFVALAKVFSRVDSLRQSQGASEVRKHADGGEVRRALAAQTNESVTANVDAIVLRVDKHFGQHPTPKLRDELRARVVDGVAAAWRRYDSLSMQCYDVPMTPSVSAVREILAKY